MDPSSALCNQSYTVLFQNEAIWKEELSDEERETLYTKAWTDTLDALYNMYNPQNFSGICLR
jgi:hypothetical protein